MKFSAHSLRTSTFATAFIAAGFLLAAPATWAQSITDSVIPEFHQVDPGVYRGARPETVGVEELAKLGVKTIVNLEDTMSAVRKETTAATALGIHELSVPMSAYDRVNENDVNRILKVLSDSSQYPIFVHCQYGHDRTGLIMGLYRVENDHWDATKAYQEMLDLDFHPEFVFLDNYFRSRTGYQN